MTGHDDLDDLDDLAMLLTYEGAIDDDPSGPEAVGPELYQLPFWTPRFCAAVIRAAELIGFEPDPDDPVPGHEVSLAAISPALYRAVEADIGIRVWPQLQEQWPLIEYQGLRDAFVIRYLPGEQESLRIHQDIAQISATVRLNDGYEGAALTFPRQGGRQRRATRRVAARVAVAGDPPARGGRAAQRREVRADHLVRAPGRGRGVLIGRLRRHRARSRENAVMCQQSQN